MGTKIQSREEKPLHLKELIILVQENIFITFPIPQATKTHFLPILVLC